MEDFAKLLLRVTLGGLMLFHGVNKIIGGVGGIRDKVVAHNLPAYVAYGVYIGEVLVPLLLIVGFLTRPSAFIFAVNMGVAVWLAHSADVFTLGKGGQWTLELQALYFVGGIAVMLLGPGRFSASRGEGKLQ